MKKKIFVYRIRHAGGSAHPIQWGTMEAIVSMEGCTPITRSARKVDAALLEKGGFLPPGVSPYDLSGGLTKSVK
jgi:hypothetical protein